LKKKQRWAHEGCSNLGKSAPDWNKQQAALMKADRENLVVQLMVFLGGRPEDMERFFALSGVAPAELRTRVSDPSFQDGLFDYVMANEPLLLAFCEEYGLEPASVARQAQSGSSGDLWP
jgi:hypothetical protein